MRILVLLLLLVATPAQATTYRLMFAGTQGFDHCTATWNGAPWVLDLQLLGTACGAAQCASVDQPASPPGSVQLECLGPGPVVRSNTIAVPAATFPTVMPTRTPTKTPTPTRTPTRTATPTPTRTAMRTPTPTATPVPTWTPLMACQCACPTPGVP